MRWPHPFGLRAVFCLPQRGQGETSAVKWWWRDPWKQRLDPDAVRRAVAPLARESLSRAETQHPSACGRACPPARSCQAPPALRTLGVRGPCCSQPKSYSCQELPAGVGKLFPSPRADQTARLAFRAWDGAPRLGTPCSLRHARTVGDPHLVPRHGDSPPRARRAPERPFKALRSGALRTPFLPHNALSPGSEAAAQQRLLIH